MHNTQFVVSGFLLIHRDRGERNSKRLGMTEQGRGREGEREIDQEREREISSAKKQKERKKERII